MHVFFMFVLTNRFIFSHPHRHHRMGVAMDAWMWPLKDELELPAQIDQPLLFINMEAFQNASNLKAMKRFTLETDHPTERRVVTLKYCLINVA